MQSSPSAAHLLARATAQLERAGIPTPQLEAAVLLAHAVGSDRTHLYARLRHPVGPQQVSAFRHSVQRRLRREPLQYIIGVQEFWSMTLQVDRRVLIPRPETEVVVEVALRLLQHQRAPHRPRILDVGTGSGCIAIALAREVPQAEVWATDISPDALIVARANAHRQGVFRQMTFVQGDLCTPLPCGVAFDLLVANLPYIPHDDLVTLQPEVRDWEPQGALDGGRDGLDCYRRLIQEGWQVLRPGGWLVMEIGHGQRAAMLDLLQRQPHLTAATCVADYAGLDRVIVARRAERNVA
ncbi:MAG: peptide chain release factor N(5)-glutamine methyltransferase [Candidatus Binatia bacterium]|nr:peptide chain release factor N(5)-glutamine methyltransferase [Candidatus Binatia bacterium]